MYQELRSIIIQSTETKVQEKKGEKKKEILSVQRMAKQ